MAFFSDEELKAFSSGRLDAPRSQAQPKKKKGFWLDQVSTGGGMAGALGGAAAGAAAGSVVPVLGTAAGGILGALIGGAAGGAGGQVVENRLAGDALGNDVLKEAALNGVFGAGPIRGASLVARTGINAARGAGKQSLAQAGAKAVTDKPIRTALGMNRLGPRMERSGRNLLGSQANLGKKDIRELGAGRTPESVISGLNERYGIRNIDQMAEVAPNVTGGSGAYSNWTKNAIGNSAGVDVGDVRTLTTNLLTDLAPNVDNGARKRLVESVKNSLVKAYGGSTGSLNPKAAPLDVFDVVQSWEKKAAELMNKATPTSADQEQAQVYRALAGEVKERLFKAPGVQEGLDLARSEAVTALRQMAKAAPTKQMKTTYERLAKEAQSVKDIGQLRGLQSDWVAAGKVNQGVEAGRAGASQALGGQAQGLGKMIQRPTNLLAVPLDAASPRVGSALARTGRALSGGTAPQRELAMGAASPLEGAQAGVAGIGRGGAIRTGIVGALTGSGAEQMTPEEEAAELDAIAQMSQENLGAEDPMMEQQVVDPIKSMFGVSQEEVAQGMVAALQAGDSKAFDDLKAMYDLIGDAAAGPGGNLNATTAKAAAQSANAESTLEGLEQMMNQAGGAKGRYAGGIQNVLASLNLNNETKTYNDLVDGSVSQVARALGETGALSDSDKQTYSRLMPRLTDTPAVAQAKFNELRRRMAIARENALLYGTGSTEDVSELVAQ